MSLVLSTWHQLVDEGSLQQGEPHLAGTGRVAVARVSPTTAAKLSIGGMVSITANWRTAVELPVAVTADMVDGVIWVPSKSPGSWVAEQLGAQAGDTVVVKGVSA